jgi:hypothetical protein
MSLTKELEPLENLFELAMRKVPLPVIVRQRKDESSMPYHRR